MGTFLQGFGAAAQGATSALQLGALATGLGAAGQVASGWGQADQYNYQAEVASRNAAITRENATAGLSAGGYVESESKTATGRLVASQRAAQASNGLDVNIGSPAAVRDSTATLGAMDAAVLHFNAARAAYGLESEAGNLDTQSELYRKAASGAKKVATAQAFSTLLSGVTSLQGKAAAFRNAFGAPRDNSMKGLY